MDHQVWRNMSRSSLSCVVNQSVTPSCLSSSCTLHLLHPQQVPLHSTSLFAYVLKIILRWEDNAGRFCHVTCQICSHLLIFPQVRVSAWVSQTTVAVFGSVEVECGGEGSIKTGLLHCSLDRLPPNRPPGRGFCIPMTPRPNQGY